MKHCIWYWTLWVLFLGVLTHPSWAYDGSVLLGDSTTLYYNFNSTNGTITITSPGGMGSWASHPSPTGTLVIPDSVVHLGVAYPVTAIDAYAFNNCLGLTAVYIPDGVTFIGNSAFTNCANLITVTGGNGLDTIDRYAFAGCSNLSSIALPDGLRHLDMYVFSECSALSTIHIPAALTSITAYTFYACFGLDSIVIPNTVTEIGAHAFGLCHHLKHLTLGAALKVIKKDAFRLTVNDRHTMHVICLAQPHPEAEEYAFFGIDEASTLTVPCSTAADYRAAEGWSRFSTIQESCDPPASIVADSLSPITISTAGRHITIQGATAGEWVALYDVAGRLLSTQRATAAPLQFTAPRAGAYLVRIAHRPAHKVIIAQ